MKLIKFIAAAACIVIANSAIAATPQKYAVEFVIYSQITAQSLSSEHWPFNNGQLDVPDNAITWPQITDNNPDSANPSAATNSNQVQSQATNNLQPITTQWQMNKIAAHIKYSRHTHLILHTGFIATREQLSSGVLLHLNSLADTENKNSSATDDDNNKTTDNSSTAQQISANGLVYVNLKKYFNMRFNFIIAAPTTDLLNIYDKWNQNRYWGEYSYFHLLSQRRMKSRELNYIDSPIAGILVLVTPITDDQG